MQSRDRSGVFRTISVATSWVLLVAAILISPGTAQAQPVETPETYGGEPLSRPRLSGSWLGVRDELAKHGVAIDLDLIQNVQSVLSGGRDTGTRLSGRGDIVVHLDTGKADLWPGGFIKFHAQGIYGQSSNLDAGAIQPIDGTALFPFPGSTFGVPNFTMTQFLSPRFGLFLGKVEPSMATRTSSRTTIKRSSRISGSISTRPVFSRRHRHWAPVSSSSHGQMLSLSPAC